MTRPTVVLDWDTNTWRAAIDTAAIIKVSVDDVRNGAFLKTIAGSRLVVESPHLQARTPLSKAQVLTQPQLEEFHAHCIANDVVVYAFPHRLTTRAGKEAGLGEYQPLTAGQKRPTWKADKQADTLAIREYVLRWEPAMRLWSPAPKSLDDEVQAIRRDVQERMNGLRSEGPDGKMVDQPDYINMMAAIKRICQTATDAEAAHIAYYGIEFLTPTGRQKKNPSIRHAEPLALWLLVRNRDGSLRTRLDGEFVGIKFLRDRVGALHQYGKGIVRSQVQWHSRRAYEQKTLGRDLHWELETDEMVAERQALRAELRSHTNWLMKQFRDI